MNKEKWIGFICISFAVVIWAGSFLTREMLIVVATGENIVFLQTLIGSVVLFFMNIFKKNRFLIPKRLIFIFMGLGVLGVAGYQTLITKSMEYVSGSIASVFVGLIPIMCYFFDCFVEKKRIKLLAMVALCISCVGLLMISYDGDETTIESIGFILLFLSNFMWVGYCVLLRKYEPQAEFLIVMFYQTLGAALFGLVLCNFEAVHLLLSTKETFIGVVYLGVCNAVLASMFFLIALKTIGITITNLMNNMIPVATIIGSIIFLKAEVSLLEWCGVFLTIVAISIMNTKYV